MNETDTQDAPSPETAFNPWKPPRAALEDRREITTKQASGSPLLIALFAPAIVIGPIIGLFMLQAWGLWFVLLAGGSLVAYLLYRRDQG